MLVLANATTHLTCLLLAVPSELGISSANLSNTIIFGQSQITNMSRGFIFFFLLLFIFLNNFWAEKRKWIEQLGYLSWNVFSVQATDAVPSPSRQVHITKPASNLTLPGCSFLFFLFSVKKVHTKWAWRLNCPFFHLIARSWVLGLYTNYRNLLPSILKARTSECCYSWDRMEGRKRIYGQIGKTCKSSCLGESLGWCSLAQKWRGR